MFGGKKKLQDAGGKEPGKRKGADLMNQMGFGAMPGMTDMGAMMYGNDDDDDDEDLEAELAALAGESYEPAPKTKPRRKANMTMNDIEKLAAAGIEDVDEDVSDTEDPDLMAELEGMVENDAPSPPPKSPQKMATQTPVQLQASPQTQMFQPSLSSNFSPPPKSIPPTDFKPPPTAITSPNSTTPDRLSSPQQAPSSALRASPAQSPAPSPRPSPSHAPRPSSAGGMVGLLEERMEMYRQASLNAKASGDTSKQRRLDRGVKTLVGLLKQAKAGKPVNEEDIPPNVAMGNSVSMQEPSVATVPDSNLLSGAARAAPPPAASPVHVQHTSPSLPSSHPGPSSSSSSVDKQSLEERRNQYRKVAVMAKQGGDMERARHCVKVAKQFDSVIQAIDDGKPVDLSQMPPSPPEFAGSALNAVNQPRTSVPVQRVAHQAAGEQEESNLPSVSAEEESAMFNAPDAPKTVMEALTQRLEKYKSSASSAKAEGESGKARRMGRIVKQYEDAIKCYRAGKAVDFDELPTPPGYGPIPKGQAPPAVAARPQPAGTAQSGAAQSAAPSPGARVAPPVASRQAPAPQPSQAPAGASGQKAPIQRQNTARKSLHSRADQQLAFLRERQGEFRQAAVNAKKNHDLEMAKKYVLSMKGLEPMIEALESGLPVDLAQVPPSPFNSEDSEDKFVVVSADECQPTGDREEVFKNVHQDLIRQIRLCVTNAQHYQKLGDIPAAAKFQKLEQNNRKDLDSLKSAHRHGDPIPKFHYETRSFSMVQCNTDLGDGDLELSIVRGIQYNLPSGYSEKDMDTCVKYELSFPTNEPQTGGTGTVKDTINPEYNETFKLVIDRKSKGFFRYVERKALKLDIFLKRGFFKGDKLLGTANVKLQPLENKCTIHESFDLMEGRKTVGGKLEIKIRIRDPLKTKQVEEVREKWLVIDQFIRTVGSKSQAQAQAPKHQSDGSTCMEVLRLEKQMLDKQIQQLKDSLSVTQTQALRHKSSLLEEKIDLQQKKLREGGMEAWKAYLAAVKTEAVGFEQEARQFTKLGEVQKAELLMTKKKYAEKEIAAIKAKIPDA